MSVLSFILFLDIFVPTVMLAIFKSSSVFSECSLFIASYYVLISQTHIFSEALNYILKFSLLTSLSLFSPVLLSRLEVFPEWMIQLQNDAAQESAHRPVGMGWSCGQVANGWGRKAVRALSCPNSFCNP